MRSTRALPFLLAFGFGWTSLCLADNESWITFAKNAGWCWFQDERAILDGRKLIFAAVAGTDGHGHQGGDVFVTEYNLDTGKVAQFELHDRLDRDDHAVPALLKLEDERYLAMYCSHGRDPFSRWRISRNPGSIESWGPEQTFRHEHGHPTYSNLLPLTVETDEEKGTQPRIYNFTRSRGWDPNWMFSDDQGRSWRWGGRLLDWPDRPYLKYASNHKDTIHFVTTDGHPRMMHNSIYHGFIRSGKLYDSEGQVVDVLDQEGLKEKTLTKLFEGDPHNVAWTVDLQLTRESWPVTVFSVQKDGASFQNNQEEGPGWDHRYFYARWNGRQWDVNEMAYAGTGLYPREADYTGLAAIDPQDPNTVYISSDVDPRTGTAKVSEVDRKRHYEIFRGRTTDGGRSWQWKPITQNSTQDNLRPVIPNSRSETRVVLWLRGQYKTYTDYATDVVGRVMKGSE